VLALFLGLILGTAMAWADGKAFPPVAVSTEVTMPDQRALLVWSNGVERLAIETRIVGEGTNFAWVVPLPSAPKVEAATVGLFPTLAWLTPPKVVNETEPGWWWTWSASGVACLFLRVRRKTPLEWMDAVAILAIGAGLVGVICLLRMPVVPVRMESPREWLIGPRRAEDAFRIVGLEFKPRDPLPTVQSVRAAIRKALNEDPAGFLSRMREEDSPRNYIVRAVPGDVEVVYFDDYGQARVYSIRKFIERQP